MNSDSFKLLHQRLRKALSDRNSADFVDAWNLLKSNDAHDIEYYGGLAIETGCWDLVPRIFHDPAMLSGGFSDVRFGEFLDIAYRSGGLLAVKKMLEFGARPWQFSRGAIKCSTMADAIEKGDLETVRYFVELGIDLQRHFTRFFTWLDWAIWYGQTEVAEYLKSHGAVHFDDIDPLIIAELYDPETVITSHFEGMGFKVETLRIDQPREFMLMAPVPILRAVQGDTQLICTAGLRNCSLAVLSNWRSWPKEQHPPAPELYFVLRPDWPAEDLRNPESPHSWPVYALHQLLYYLATNDTDVGIGPMYVPSGNSQTLIPGKDCPGALIVEINDFLDRTPFPDYDQCDIGFLHVLPLYRSEADYLKKKGFKQFAKKMGDLNGLYLDPDRRPLF